MAIGLQRLVNIWIGANSTKKSTVFQKLIIFLFKKNSNESKYASPTEENEAKTSANSKQTSTHQKLENDKNKNSSSEVALLKPKNHQTDK